MDTTFKGAAKRITALDIPRIGAMVGVGEDEIHAFMDVEAAGSGFDAKGRPKLLFEPHVFYRNLAGAKRTAAVKAGLAYSKWGAKPYPKDSYPRLVAAMAIDETAALKSASWGLTQILGENFKAAGCGSVQAMVQAFMADEAAHLEATVKLLVAWKVDDDLRAHRWPVVAQTWNGPGYKKNRYDSKLAAAFAKWQKIRDTPWPPKARAPAVVAAEELSAELAAGASVEPDTAPPAVDKATIERVQQQLKDLGYTEVGGVSGVGGTMTSAAIRAFRAENGLPEGDEIDDALLLALQKAKPRVLAPARTNAPPEVVREKVPEVRTNWLAKVGAFFTTIAALIGSFFDGIIGNLGPASGYIQPVKDAAGDVPGWVWMLAIAGVAGGLFLVARHGEKKGVEAFQSGERR
ncbi:N-acetylmuramidase domain-containing protein [Mesorhizobium sp. YC-39]|uniref:N-acetylmuramidase family protein n=1 Tax=unclassified Mesorhizobium TaxID=325217 RepID=UPI0021E917E3|nr:MULTISPECIES: N-acetylmuramidase domain-containing protein [unclassified Mesorhizobium]MCV3209591.1 N-acetylmuramidase domain-containing protein [Mesorhizobium sp. YC-2]MCV3230121.1 N-acetylmuramidase domain-containing protein [Mesorhizobium sp. YC-39]